MDQDQKVRENRLRRAAERQGLYLVKSRRRDPRAIDYGTYLLAVIQTREIVCGAPVGGSTNGSATLDQIEEFLNRDPGKD